MKASALFSNALYRLSHWETWHWIVKYIPMMPVWFWHCLRARSCWFFSPSNPTLTFGGFEGETKSEMYAQLPDGTYPTTLLVSPSVSFSLVEQAVRNGRLSYPIAVKPDAGRMGLMFRKIGSPAELKAYHQLMQADYLIQEFVHYPLEVSVFYYRFPGEEKGTISGFVKKEYLTVTGDGRSSLWELMLAYPRIRFRLDELTAKHRDKLNTILPSGEAFVLSHALNLSRGGKLISLEEQKDDRLLAVFDRLSHRCKFYFGRYDIRCASVEDLRQNKNYSILEFNGSGAEPHHVYGNGNSFFRAIGILLQHWNILYRISIAQHKAGIPYWGFRQGLVHMIKASKHIAMLRKLEMASGPESAHRVVKLQRSGGSFTEALHTTPSLQKSPGNDH